MNCKQKKIIIDLQKERNQKIYSGFNLILINSSTYALIRKLCMKEVMPYEKLAYIYDHLMDHVDYTKWAEYIIEIINHVDPKINSLIDLL